MENRSESLDVITALHAPEFAIIENSERQSEISKYRRCVGSIASAGEKDRKAVKHAITGALHRYFRRKLDREPMVVPVIVEV